jgi:ATP-dependent DNA helicase RecG
MSKLASLLGDRTAKVIAAELSIERSEDLLRYYPRRYVMRGELTDFNSLILGEDVTIFAQIESSQVRRIPGRKGVIVETIVTDGKSKLTLTFFNQAWREKELRPGREGLFAGKVGQFKNKRQLSHPDYLLIPEGEDPAHAIGDFAGRYLPVYPATAKLPSWKIAQCVKIALSATEHFDDFLPRNIAEKLNYPQLMKALHDVHQPEDLESAQRARERLTFDEALLMQVFLLQRKAQLKSQRSLPRISKNSQLLELFDDRLPFTLTHGQERVQREISDDLGLSHPMYRLLQGDVGSGKTVLALRAMLSVVDSGGQAALLAPTEVLAQQHHRNLLNLMGNLSGGVLGGVAIELLTGSLPNSSKRRIHGAIASGEADIVIGTHALLSEGVEFKDLGLIVIDEQHRFGVEQRDALRGRGKIIPHVLVMTATPIPRTVAMTVFGDLDISILDELPLGRAPITSHLVSASEKPSHVQRAWERVREEVALGHQVYIVAPRISESDNSDFNLYGFSESEIAQISKLLGKAPKLEKSYSVEDLYHELSRADLAGLKIGKLHGRMNSDEKESAMRAFVEGEIEVLIATTVIEVGVDVPNATMMVILDADRFGVSQLHQLRGRVGRGSGAGLCIFITSLTPEHPTYERLAAVAATTNGFELSRIDLEQRREGDVLGDAQSGARSHLRLLRVIRDEEIIIKARSIAEELLLDDPLLENNPLLQGEIDRLHQEERTAYLEKK